jgi:hypothetical protein
MGRRRVFVTAGLSASAAVLAMAVQVGQADDGVIGSAYGDAAPVQASAVEPEADDADPDE